MDKKAVYLIIAVIVIALAAWFWMKQPASAPAPAAPATGMQGTTGADDTASINKDINNITVQDPNFNAIDQGVNSL